VVLFTSWSSPARILYQYDILFGFSSGITTPDILAPPILLYTVISFSGGHTASGRYDSYFYITLV
jgi:hypothetical protein